MVIFSRAVQTEAFLSRIGESTLSSTRGKGVASTVSRRVTKQSHWVDGAQSGDRFVVGWRYFLL